MTKKNILLISGAAVLILCILDFLQGLTFCRNDAWGGGGCIDAIYYIGTSSLPVLPFFLFSLITYKMREEIFRAWWGFACWWTPLAMLLISISPQYADGFMMSPSPKGLAVVGTSVLFAIISITIILNTWLKLRKQPEVHEKK